VVKCCGMCFVDACVFNTFPRYGFEYTQCTTRKTQQWKHKYLVYHDSSDLAPLSEATLLIWDLPRSNRVLHWSITCLLVDQLWYTSDRATLHTHRHVLSTSGVCCICNVLYNIVVLHTQLCGNIKRHICSRTNSRSPYKSYN
jgi:hypothetical protein